MRTRQPPKRVVTVASGLEHRRVTAIEHAAASRAAVLSEKRVRLLLDVDEIDERDDVARSAHVSSGLAAIATQLQSHSAATRLSAVRRARQAATRSVGDAVVLLNADVGRLIVPLLHPCGRQRVHADNSVMFDEDARLEALWFVAAAAAHLSGPALLPLLPAGAYISQLVLGSSSTPGLPAIFTVAGVWALGNLAADGDAQIANVMIQQGAMAALVSALRIGECCAVAAWALRVLVRGACRAHGSGDIVLRGTSDNGAMDSAATHAAGQTAVLAARTPQLPQLVRLLRQVEAVGVAEVALLPFVAAATAAEGASGSTTPLRPAVEGLRFDCASVDAAQECAWLLAELAHIAALTIANCMSGDHAAPSARKAELVDIGMTAAATLNRTVTKAAIVAIPLLSASGMPAVMQSSPMDTAEHVGINIPLERRALLMPCVRLLGLSATICIAVNVKPDGSLTKRNSVVACTSEGTSPTGPSNHCDDALTAPRGAMLCEALASWISPTAATSSEGSPSPEEAMWLAQRLVEASTQRGDASCALTRPGANGECVRSAAFAWLRGRGDDTNVTVASVTHEICRREAARLLAVIDATNKVLSPD